ncbi:MAG: VOC family protein [Kibdelosporangium sp.]
MPTLPLLRQVVLLTGDLPGTLARTKSALGLRDGVRDESGMAALGFEHEVLAIDQTFVEIVAPLSEDSSPGRLLRRGGECGYMVAIQVEDADAVVARAATIGLKPVMRTVYEGNPLTQWHPRDLGTLAEIDEMRSGADWHFCPELSDTGSTSVVTDIVAVELAVPDPAGYAQRWATLLGLDIPDGSTALDLGGRALRFVPATEGRDGLVTVELAATTGTAQHTLCGVRFAVVPAVQA